MKPNKQREHKLCHDGRAAFHFLNADVRSLSPFKCDTSSLCFQEPVAGPQHYSYLPGLGRHCAMGNTTLQIPSAASRWAHACGSRPAKNHTCTICFIRSEIRLLCACCAAPMASNFENARCSLSTNCATLTMCTKQNPTLNVQVLQFNLFFSACASSQTRRVLKGSSAPRKPLWMTAAEQQSDK